MKINKTLGILLLSTIAVTVGCAKEPKQDNTEISPPEYTILKDQYNYVKNSVAGDDLKKMLKEAMRDGKVSKTEFLKITGNDAKEVILESSITQPELLRGKQDKADLMKTIGL